MSTLSPPRPSSHVEDPVSIRHGLSSKTPRAWAASCRKYYDDARSVVLPWIPSLRFRRRESVLVAWIVLVTCVLALLYAQLDVPAAYYLERFQVKGGPLNNSTRTTSKDTLLQQMEPEEETTLFEITNSLIPPKIWQIFFTPEAPEAHEPEPKSREDGHEEDESNKESKREAIDAAALVDTPSWLARNPDFAYTLVGNAGGDTFVRQHFGHDESPAGVLATYRALRNPGLKSDLLRYLVLSISGGVYTDTDTECYQPISTWIPAAYRSRARVVVGVEFDRLDGPYWADISHDVQFCQWTIAAAPGHPLLAAMAESAVRNLHTLARAHNTTLAELERGHTTRTARTTTPTAAQHEGQKRGSSISSFEVMNSTGPAAWTDAVFAAIQQAARNDGANLTSTRDLSGMTAPVLWGDVLVLPVDGFGMGQPHSNSTNDGSVPAEALVRHHFRGSWREEGMV